MLLRAAAAPGWDSIASVLKRLFARKINLNQEVASAIISAQPIRSLDAVSDRPESLPTLFFFSLLSRSRQTRDALLAGIPNDDNRLTVALLGRAARRASLEVEPVRRVIGAIPRSSCPRMLVSADQSARILTKIDAVTQKLTSSNRPRANRSKVASTLEHDDFSHVFFVRPAAATSERAAAAGDLPKSHWFWGSFAASERIQPVAIAAFIVNVLGLAAPLFTMNVYDRVVPNGAIPSLAALAIRLALAIVFDFLLRTVRARIIDMTGKKLDVDSRRRYFRARPLDQDGPAADIGRCPGQPDAGFRFGARVLHLRHRRCLPRIFCSHCFSSPCCS